MSENKNISASKMAFSSFLKKEGLRETYERKVILEAIHDSEKHFTPEALLQLLLAKGERISRATVYNTLNLLIKSGIVQRFQFADGQFHYQLSKLQGVTRQVHMICNSCGRISDLKTQSIQKQLASFDFGTFIPQSITLAVYGMCSRCAKKQRALEADKLQQLKLFK